MKYRVSEEVPGPQDYNQLRHSAGWGTFDEEAAAKGLSNALFTVTVYDSGRLIAMGRVTGDGAMYFYIQDVIVLPEYQGKGLGGAVMDRIMDYIGRNAPVNSVVGLMSARGKEEFYRRYGFIRRPDDFLGCGMSLCIGFDQ